jgi:glycosyltransferase involved in cell wall biosynthesis
MATPVSVLIPAYNCADLIPETLDCILSQTLPPAEVIVVDDGSRDNTREVVARFGHRVRYHPQQNGGICRARNAAAGLATSRFLAFCDHDDLWRRDKLEQQMELHERNPALEYSFTNFSLVVNGIWSKTTKLQQTPQDFFDPSPPPGSAPFVFAHSLYRSLLIFQPVWPSTVLIARSFFDQLGGFREEFGKNPSEDFEFTLRCVQQGPVGVVREPVVGVRRHAANYSGDNFANTRGQIEILEYALDHHTLSESTRKLVREQINLRRVEAAYAAFRRGEFDQVVSLISHLPSSYLDGKSKLKLAISRLPPAIARRAHRLLVKN